MKKLLITLCGVLMLVPLVYGLVSYFVSEKGDAEKFVIVDITMDNYMDYIDVKATDTAIDIDGNPIDHTCVVITSKVYDDGLYYISSEDSKWSGDWNGEGYGIIGASPFGTVLEDVDNPDNIKITDVQGKYKFVKSEYVEEYVFEDGVRRITLKDGRYQETIFEGISAVDFSNPY